MTKLTREEKTAKMVRLMSKSEAVSFQVRKDAGLISVNDAVTKGITHLQNPKWSNKLDHIELIIIDGQLGPWINLWCPFNKICNGRDPVQTLCIDHGLDDPCFVRYDGPRWDSEEYKSAVAEYDKVGLI